MTAVGYRLISLNKTDRGPDTALLPLSRMALSRQFPTGWRWASSFTIPETNEMEGTSKCDSEHMAVDEIDSLFSLKVEISARGAELKRSESAVVVSALVVKTEGRLRALYKCPLLPFQRLVLP